MQVSVSSSSAPVRVVLSSANISNKFNTSLGTRVRFIITDTSRRQYMCLAQWLPYVPPAVQHSTILPSAHTVYLCVLCGSENKQRLVPLTA